MNNSQFIINRQKTKPNVNGEHFTKTRKNN